MASPAVKRFNIQGASCAGCVRKIENGLSKVDGVDSASLNFANRSLCVSGTISARDVITAVENIGYGAQEQNYSSLQAEEDQREQIVAQEARTLLISSITTLLAGSLLMLFGFNAGMSVESESQQYMWAALGIISLIIIVKSHRHTYISGWRSTLNKAPSMDTLVALGTASAWLYSVVVVVFYEHFPDSARHVYFEASLMILGFISLGKYLEVKARSKTSSAIKHLLSRQADSAILITPEGDKIVPIEAIGIGKHLRVRPGSQIPLDGTLIEGQGYIDESMLTGESDPILKRAGDAVFAGCTNNKASLVIEVTKRAADSTLANIIRAVKTAQGAKPAIGQLVDEIALFFVPAIIVIAIIAAVAWYIFGPAPQLHFALIVMVSVLIIACPCALGLATPMSVMVGVGKAAEHGILIQNGQGLQESARIETLVIDKTGTLTEGKPSVTATYIYQEHPQLWAFAMALESHSEHPLGQAIVKFCKDHTHTNLNAVAVNIEQGQGLSGTIDGHVVEIGSEIYFRNQGIEICELPKAHASLALMAIDKKHCATFSIADPLKQDTASAISNIKSMGIEVIILSGDNDQAVASVAKELGISEWHARTSPAAKMEFIKQLQAQNKVVAMAGDGINDAPALALANVSFAMGSGTDVALSSADIALMHNSLQGVYNAIHVSKATMVNIKQNLFWAFAYNLICIPLAAGLFYPLTGTLLNPMIAGAAMALSSVTVATNALRLRRVKFTF
jgi:Cu+-exporting ATPase